MFASSLIYLFKLSALSTQTKESSKRKPEIFLFFHFSKLANVKFSLRFSPTIQQCVRIVGILFFFTPLETSFRTSFEFLTELKCVKISSMDTKLHIVVRISEFQRKTYFLMTFWRFQLNLISLYKFSISLWYLQSDFRSNYYKIPCFFLTEQEF